MQVLQAVHDGNDPHPLFKGLQLGRNAGGGKPLLPQADGLPRDDGLALGRGLGIDDVDFGVGLGGGQAGALVGAGKLLRDSDDNDLIPCIGSFLKQLDKRSRAGLAGAGQLAVLGQAGEELVLGHAAVIHGGGAIGKGDAHGHNGHAGGLQVAGGQIGRRVSDDTNHSRIPFSYFPIRKNSFLQCPADRRRHRGLTAAPIPACG